MTATVEASADLRDPWIEILSEPVVTGWDVLTGDPWMRIDIGGFDQRGFARLRLEP